MFSQFLKLKSGKKVSNSLTKDKRCELDVIWFCWFLLRCVYAITFYSIDNVFIRKKKKQKLLTCWFIRFYINFKIEKSFAEKMCHTHCALCYFPTRCLALILHQQKKLNIFCDLFPYGFQKNIEIESSSHTRKHLNLHQDQNIIFTRRKSTNPTI